MKLEKLDSTLSRNPSILNARSTAYDKYTSKIYSSRTLPIKTSTGSFAK
jgi:hypothetical protein